MNSYLAIEVPDEAVAEELRLHLQSFDADAVEAETHWELRIQLAERNPEIPLKSALHAIDSWLPEADIDFVRVHLDGRSYTLEAHHPEAVEARAG
jgi:uncharacterized protein with PIN domain